MLLGLGVAGEAFGQGSLTPPGAPGPTMKTLAQIEPRTPISSVPYSITNAGSYYLTTNLTGTYGITISSGNVNLDLNGFTLQGAPGGSSGIFISGSYNNIAVRNGTITGWQGCGVDGYFAGFPQNTLYENLLVSSNLDQGIAAEADSVVRHCEAVGNGSAAGSAGILCVGGEVVDCISRGSIYGFNVTGGTVRNCRSEYNLTGMNIVSGTVIGCRVDNNTYGIYLDGGNNVVRQCHVVGDGTGQYIIWTTGGQSGGGVIADSFVSRGLVGIALYSPGYQVLNNTVTQNTSVGIWLQNSNNRVDGNSVISTNGAYGIEVNSGYTNNVIIRNVVSGGGALNYFNPGNNDFGPIGSAATATSPWANISHP